MIWPPPPPGFVLADGGGRALYASAENASEAVALGLDRPETWESALASGSARSGRGATAVIGRAAPPDWRIKRMRRGGMTARLWRDRYPRPRRLVAMIDASREAVARGVPAPRPVALLLEQAPAALVRGWAAFEEVARGEDLAARARRGALTRDDLRAALVAVRLLHERGIDHADLNLGNLLVRNGPDGAGVEAFVLDLDRARLGPTAPLSPARRRAALRRLARSCAKITGSPAPLGPGTESAWIELYAGDDPGLARRLERGHTAGRLGLAWHRAGWRSRPR